MEEIIEKMNGFENRFHKDPQVEELVGKLKARFKEMFDETFPVEEVVSDEFDSFCNDYYETCKELDPDEVMIFQVLWFN